jgi:hypothetical protein
MKSKQSYYFRINKKNPFFRGVTLIFPGVFLSSLLDISQQIRSGYILNTI